jgi:hypothetical protein
VARKERGKLFSTLEAGINIQLRVLCGCGKPFTGR